MDRRLAGFIDVLLLLGVFGSGVASLVVALSSWEVATRTATILIALTAVFGVLWKIWERATESWIEAGEGQARDEAMMSKLNEIEQLMERDRRERRDLIERLARLEERIERVQG